MGDSNCSFSLSNLICEEDAAHFDLNPNYSEEAGEEEEEVFIVLKNSCFFLETEDEYIGMLVSKESSFESRPSGVSSCEDFGRAENLLARARCDSVRWVLEMKACFGFGLQTTYLAMSYFDRFFVRRTIEEGKTWAMRLLAVACLSLAAKMEEYRPPALSEYRLEEYQFSSNVIQRMELLVLNTLEWRMSSVTPFAYLDYFASKFQLKNGRKVLHSRASGFIFAIIGALNLANYRPSTIAAAAILAASGDRLTKKSVEAKMSVTSLPESLETDNVFSCYSLMIQESQKQKLKPPKLLVSSEASANFASVSNSGDLNNTKYISSASNKRRRLQSPQI